MHIPFVCAFNSQFLARFLIDPLAYPVVSSFMLFCVNLLHSFIKLLIVSSQSPQNVHFLFCCVLLILAIIHPLEFLTSALADSFSQEV